MKATHTNEFSRARVNTSQRSIVIWLREAGTFTIIIIIII